MTRTITTNARRYGITMRLLAERVLLTKVAACYETAEPGIVKCEMPDHTYRYFNFKDKTQVEEPGTKPSKKSAPMVVTEEPSWEPEDPPTFGPIDAPRPRKGGRKTTRKTGKS